MLSPTNHPDPFVPPDADLRDFPFMPIEIVLLFGSEFHAQSTDTEWRAGMTLWLRSYHQVPAGSLPDDEVALARLAEFGRDTKSWRKTAPGALRGWVKCSDGRLYHRVVSEKVLEGWVQKLMQRKASAAASAKRRKASFDAEVFDQKVEAAMQFLRRLNANSRIVLKRERSATREELSDMPDQPGDCPPGHPPGSPGGPPDGCPHGAPPGPPDGIPDGRPRDREGNLSFSLRSNDARDARSAFDREFWPKYPNKVGKPAAAKAFEKLWRELRGDMVPIVAGLERYVRSKPADRPWLNPATFLNQRRFEDEPAQSAGASKPLPSDPRIDFGGGVCWPETSVRATLDRWRTDPKTWPESHLGPPPGTPGCRVPERLLEDA